MADKPAMHISVYFITEFCGVLPDESSSTLHKEIHQLNNSLRESAFLQ